MKLIDRFIDWMLPVTIFLLVVLMTLILSDDCNSEHFSLKKSAWACSKENTSYHTGVIPMGKIMIPHTRPVTECIQWTRR